ncbi:MAG: amidohydrolase, partial [Aestuariivirga sp.]
MSEIADLIIANGKIITMDDGNPQVEAVAIKDGRILAAGIWNEISKLAGSKTRHFDAQGRTVMPGINESHIHIFGGSAELDHLSLFKMQGFETIKNAI